MPKATPSIKVRNVSRLGAKVVLYGQDFDEAKTECARLASTYGLVFVPPYDDPLVIAGQGTVGAEILKQMPNPETLDGIVAGVGGGGLVAGISEYVKRIGSPKTKIIGAETVDADAMDRSLKKGERVTLPEVGLFSDGTAVKIVGEEPFRICKRLLDGVIKVDTDEICAAIKDVFEGAPITFKSHAARIDDGFLLSSETRSITEPAGALALAGLKRYIVDNQLVGAEKKFVAVISGANMNFDRLRFVAERAELGEGREALLSVEIPEKPGRCVPCGTTATGGPLGVSCGLRPSSRDRRSNASDEQLCCVARHDTPACDHRVRLQVPPPRKRPDILVVPAPEHEPRKGSVRAPRCARRKGHEGLRHQRERDGEKPRPLHDRRVYRSAQRATV